jgi:hypothetical protein
VWGEFHVVLIYLVGAAKEIYQTAPEYRRECSYYIALGYYKLGNYGMGRKFNGMTLWQTFAHRDLLMPFG